MANVLLIILLIISIILIGLILIQRSEGGALGIGGGGGGGGGGFMSGRGTTDMVQKLTSIMGAVFLGVCLLISIAFNIENQDKGLLDADSAQEEILKQQETEIPPLNLDTDTGNDTAPLAEDSKTEESDAEPQEKPQEDPQD